MRLAGIDIGTLTCRLLIAQVTPEGQVKALDADRRIVRLGEGVDQGKCLNARAMAQVVETIREWQKRIETHDVRGAIAVATSAVREAQNREEFLARVKNETGLEIEVIDGKEEARRTLLGIQYGLPQDVSDWLGLDIGGGSTEFILSRQGALADVVSVDLGVVRLTERVLKTDPPTLGEIDEAKRLILNHTREAVRSWENLAGVALVGTAGTITTLAAMAQSLTTYQPERVHNYSLGLETVLGIEKDLIGRPKAARVGVPGLEAGREDVIVAGTLILRCIMEDLGFDRCLVSEYGLREGMLIDLARRMAHHP